MQADICEHRAFRPGISKTHVVKHDISTGSIKCELTLIGLRRRVNLSEQILSGGKASLDDALHVGQRANGLTQLGRRGNERNQRTRRKASENRGVQREPKQRRQSQCQQHLSDRR